MNSSNGFMKFNSKRQQGTPRAQECLLKIEFVPRWQEGGDPGFPLRAAEASEPGGMVVCSGKFIPE